MKNPEIPTVQSIPDLRELRKKLEEPVGLVPTMGYLHEGHLSLVKQAKQECASVVVSIFVNPTQFGPQEDLSSYPRDLQRDLQLLREAGTNLVWNPTPDDMYPHGYQTWVELEELVKPLEGSMRPGHFRGVATVVAKLFNAVQPQKAYFGQKDAQQAAVIKRMAQDLNFPIDVVICPIVRADDGLALSSRNIYLDKDERKAATILYRSLQAAREAYGKGELDATVLRQIVTDMVNGEPLAKLQYISCADLETLEELERVSGKALLSMAVYFGNTRLIDNTILK
jgi:pantoate--beta-alanine ligase